MTLHALWTAPGLLAWPPGLSGLPWTLGGGGLNSSALHHAFRCHLEAGWCALTVGLVEGLQLLLCPTLPSAACWHMHSIPWCWQLVWAGGVSKRAHAHTQAWPEGDSISPVSTCLARCRPGPSRRSRAAPPGPQSCVWPMAFMRERILQHTAADNSVRWQRRQLSRCWHSGDMQT
jgi:hypothetical protein